MDAILGAVLVVKNEVATIGKTLETLIGVVDAITVLDTGSTDGTLAIYGMHFGRWIGGSFHVAEEPFVDYASARNRVLEIAAERHKTIFTLTLSADEVLIGGAELCAFLESHRDAPEGAYCVMMRSGPRQWPFPRILRTGAGWKYVNTAGERHETPSSPAGEIVGPLIPGVFVVHEESNQARKYARLREQDLPDLTVVVEDESKSLSDRLESMFQLAETHFVLGDYEKKNNDKMQDLGGNWLSHYFASMALYVRYGKIAETFAIKMKESKNPDWQYLFQRARYANLMYLQVAETFGLFEPTELVKRLTLVAFMAPDLPEAHWALARNVAKTNDDKTAIELALTSAKVARKVYDRPVHGPVDSTLEWQSYLLAAVCARNVQDSRQMEFVQQALQAGAPPDKIGTLARA